MVAPFAGAWIEICTGLADFFKAPSLPSRERGLKSYTSTGYVRRNCVAPFAGAWIEIYPAVMMMKYYPVAPFAGAWIEIDN